MKTVTVYAPNVTVEVLDSVAQPPTPQTIGSFTATPSSINQSIDGDGSAT